VAQAVKTILRADYNGQFEPHNPWSISYHLEGCDDLTIWRDDGESLIELNELRDETTNKIKCGACRHQHGLWASLLALADDGEPPTRYGDLAYRGLMLANKVLTWGFAASELDGFDYQLMQVSHAAQKQFETWLIIEQRKKAEKEREE
jgi:hypothetical protein